MKMRYDAETDTLTLTLRDTPVSESEEERLGVVILDYAADGMLTGLEILDASRRVTRPTSDQGSSRYVPAPAAPRAAARRLQRATRSFSTRGTSKDGWLVTRDNIAFDPKGRAWICTDGANDFL